VPHWSNWSGRVSARPVEIARVADEAGAMAAVRRAVRARSALRSLGAGHSHAPLVATSGVLLDTHDLPVALPARGVVVRASGIGGAYELVSLDSDARTLRVLVHGDQPLDTTITLDAAQLRRLDDLATRAWSEVQHGRMHDANDIVEDLYILDHDDAFHLRGYPIHEPGAASGRPVAAELVGAMFQLAVPVIERPASGKK